MSSTALEARKTFDLTRAPNEQWNQEMVEVVTKNVFRGKDITLPQLYYCLSIADALALNPMIGEIYFLPTKGRDATGPAWQAYVGRNGLVKKASDRRYHYESDTVHERDKFRMTRRRDGTVEVTHSYTQADRGEIVGAYAFLHDDTGKRKPAFFYAPLSEYLPTFDQDWKMGKSPWGNTRSAMIEKCAMIGAGRKRLDLGTALIDAEGAIVLQMAQGGPGAPRAAIEASVEDFEFSQVTDDPDLAGELEEAVGRVNQLAPMAWPPARCEMVMAGKTDDELRALVETLKADAESLADQAPAGAASEPAGTDGSDAGAGSTPEGADRTEAENAPDEIADAEVVHEPPVAEDPGPRTVSPENVERLAGLDKRRAELEDVTNDPYADERQRAEAATELEAIDHQARAITNGDTPLFQ